MGERVAILDQALERLGKYIKITLIRLIGNIKASHSLGRVTKVKQALLILLLVSTFSRGESIACNILPTESEKSITSECPTADYKLVNGGVHVYVFTLSKLDKYGEPINVYFAYSKGKLISVTKFMPVFV